MPPALDKLTHGGFTIGIELPLDNDWSANGDAKRLRDGRRHGVPDIEHHATLAKLADSLGFRALWVRDVPVYDPAFGDAAQVFEAFSYLGYLAGITRNVLLGTAAVVLPLREPLPLSPPSPNDIEAWVKAADDSSFSVAIARAGLEIARQEVDRQRAGHLPTLDLNGTATRVDDPTSAVPPISPISNLGSVGVQLTVPIFAGGLTQSRVREAVALRDRAEQDLENTQRTVAQTVRAGFLVVSSGISQVRALEQALVSTQSLLDSTILGRDVGVRTSVDVLNAQQQVYQTRRDLQQARYNFLLNSLRLKAATGQLTEADVEEVNRALARG